ncbi:MAG: hypothetical protein KME45_30760 [Stenomitos rutilans HA7619-LM2]|jgi:hypothetical protein|nr:hypothetical protein [Stenomitos rutilans HA7619-LM2]
MPSQKIKTSSQPRRRRATYNPKQEQYRLRLMQARWASQLYWCVNATSAGLIASATFFFITGQINQAVASGVGGTLSTAFHRRVEEMEREANNRLDKAVRAQRRKAPPRKAPPAKQRGD